MRQRLPTPFYQVLLCSLEHPTNNQLAPLYTIIIIIIFDIIMGIITGICITNMNTLKLS